MEIGKQLILVGIVIVVLGIVLSYYKESLSWFGNLPGDLKLGKANFKIYLPFMSMILLSALLKLIYWVVNYLKH